MPKSSLPTLVFNGVSLSIIRQNNQTYFSATDIAKSVGYQSDDAISRIYRRNADEFTADMSETVNLTVSGNIQKTVRLFSLRGAHLVAMFSRTSKAKEFRRWVLDILDKEASQSAMATLPAVRVLTTIEQTNINMRAHVLAQEKYREIRGELTHSPINRYAVCELGSSYITGAYCRRTSRLSGFFVRKHGYPYGRAVWDTFGCAVSCDAVCQPTQSCPPSWQGVSKVQNPITGVSHD